MKNDVFIRQFARKAALTSLTGVFLMPQDHAAVPPQPLLDNQAVCSGSNHFREPRTITTSANLPLTFSQTPSEWKKADEKEFRHLAFKEATGSISDSETQRLNRLSRARDHRLNPLSGEEVLLQIRRDRILEKMAEILEDYVEFTESAGNKRTSA
jgi:hypothetical protein